MQGNKLELKITKLKSKNKSYQKERDFLKRKLRDVETSREKWREKSLALGQENQLLTKELSNFKGDSIFSLKEKVKHHSYPVFIIVLCLSLRQVSGLGFRKCSEVVSLFYNLLGLNLSVPCAKTISNWVEKYGYFELEKTENQGKPQVLIVDESVNVGQKKALLLQSVTLANYKFGNSLTHQDTDLFGLGIGKSWKGVEISKIIEASPLKSDIVYCVCDGASNLAKALEISEIERVYDITHALGKLIKKRYAKNESFVAFSKATTLFKQKVVLGKGAILMPPVQRPKARFLNIDSLVKWAKKMLLLLKTDFLTQEQKQQLQWLLAYQHLIMEMAEINQLVLAIFKIVKPEGLSKLTQTRCVNLLTESKAPQQFKEAVKEYLFSYEDLIKKHTTIICCSDVIESTFGKFKNRIAANKMNAITGAALEMGTYGIQFDPQQVKKVMETIPLKQVKEWKDKNQADNLAQNRRVLMKKVG